MGEGIQSGERVEMGVTCFPRILYLAILCIKNEGDMKTFLDKQRVIFFVYRLALQETLNDVIQAEMIPDGNSNLQKEMKNTGNGK